MVKLDRGLGLLQAVSANVIMMIGVGPFLTIPYMLSAMGGPHIIYAWLAGAVLAMCDGLVYAQLGAALPGSGGPYVYLREAYQPFGMGRLLAFVFTFQIILIAPLSIAGAAVGFANYLQFYWTSMTPVQHHAIAATVCIVMTAALYRHISDVGRLSVIMLGVVLVTVGWVILAGLIKFSAAQAFDFPPEAYRLDSDLLAKIGAVSLLAMYNYGGYNNVCNIGEEIREPHRTIPRAIILSILLVVAIYVVMSTVIIGMVPWEQAKDSPMIASVFIERTFSDPAQGRIAAIVMTALILFVTASSLYAVILGYSRIPFAAAREGQFFRVFERVHPTKHFPHVSLVTLSGLAIPFCFFPLGMLVEWLMQIQIVTQFVWQCAAVILLRRYRTDIGQPFTMWLYPVPALIALALWSYVFLTSPLRGQLIAAAFLAIAIAAFFVFDSNREPRPGVQAAS